MTKDEALELLKKDMQKARKLEIRVSEIESEIFNILEQLNIDIDVDSDAENANHLEDAIQCYIQYGEYTIKDIISEINEQLKEN